MNRVVRTDLKLLYAASAATAAFSVDGSTPLPTATRPTGTASHKAIDCGQFPAVRFIFAGTDAADETVNYQVVAWTYGCGVYIPHVIASGAYTLGAMPMTVAGLDTTATLLADTITDTLSMPGVLERSTAANTCCDLTVWPGGAQYLTVETDLGTAAAASVYWQVTDAIEFHMPA